MPISMRKITLYYVDFTYRMWQLLPRQESDKAELRHGKRIWRFGQQSECEEGISIAPLPFYVLRPSLYSSELRNKPVPLEGPYDCTVQLSGMLDTLRV